MSKTCTKCNVTYEDVKKFFYENNYGKTFKTVCKKCDNKRRIVQKSTNRKHINGQAQNYRKNLPNYYVIYLIKQDLKYSNTFYPISNEMIELKKCSIELKRQKKELTNLLKELENECSKSRCSRT